MSNFDSDGWLRELTFRWDNARQDNLADVVCNWFEDAVIDLQSPELVGEIYQIFCHSAGPEHAQDADAILDTLLGRIE